MIGVGHREPVNTWLQLFCAPLHPAGSCVLLPASSYHSTPPFALHALLARLIDPRFVLQVISLVCVDRFFDPRFALQMISRALPAPWLGACVWPLALLLRFFRFPSVVLAPLFLHSPCSCSRQNECAGARCAFTLLVVCAASPGFPFFSPAFPFSSSRLCRGALLGCLDFASHAFRVCCDRVVSAFHPACLVLFLPALRFEFVVTVSILRVASRALPFVGFLSYFECPSFCCTGAALCRLVRLLCGSVHLVKPTAGSPRFGCLCQVC